jgi:hypothetical protein
MRSTLFYQPAHAQLQFDEKLFTLSQFAHAQFQLDEKLFVLSVWACAVSF